MSWTSAARRICSWSAWRPRASSTSSASRARRRWISTSRSSDSAIEFVPVRHEQGGAYMADMYGRLTRTAGVCLGTLGPGATNLVTAVADALLDHSPLVALTGQGDLERMHKESPPVHRRRLDVQADHEVERAAAVAGRDPGGGAQGVQGRPGAEAGADAHRAARGRDGGAGRRRAAARSAGSAAGPSRARRSSRRRRSSSAARRTRSCSPATASRASAPRPRCARSPHATGMGVAATFMGKGVLDDDDPHWRGTVGMQARDYELAGFEDADVVITVGYDLVEHAPRNWNGRSATSTIVCIDTASAEVDEHFMTAVDLIGDIDADPAHASPRSSRATGAPRPRRRRGSRTSSSARFEAGRDDDAFPMHPPRALWEIRAGARAARTCSISDVGLHKLWIARMFPAHEPDTVFIANGLAGMGIALPTAIAAKLVHPERKVVTVNGDGGFLMNCQELETADAPAHADRQRDLGERPVRLDRLEAGQEVRPPLRRRLHEPRLRQARRGVRHAGLPLRGGRRLRARPAPRPRPRRPVADRACRSTTRWTSPSRKNSERRPSPHEHHHATRSGRRSMRSRRSSSSAASGATPRAAPRSPSRTRRRARRSPRSPTPRPTTRRRRSTPPRGRRPSGPRTRRASAARSCAARSRRSPSAPTSSRC